MRLLYLLRMRVLSCYQSAIQRSIENGGENIPVENLQALRQRISGVTRHLDEKPDTGLKQGHSIGLENIQRRIQLVYSDKYGLDIANIEGGGVLVEIRLPLKYTLGGEDNRDRSTDSPHV